ncbi:TPA: hypothetical protein K8250_004338 [Escherichia coli]|uniref:hypothetical protein n=2 Tax=Escherichia coli TaxID=562 RepID=UPI001319F5DB|nr:hypothetical protein [Escherichia coli]EFA9198235.1 hypothetical protein [Escherichia coli]EFH3137863.1 hypothetical protein [Escherichia coli]EFH3533103.1 hypothetical protein [Escherichia coli]EFH6520708.1 hypothetical protein [Escherichia coli]EFH6579165.1 hypothetical protein [Escherichia coli]
MTAGVAACAMVAASDMLRVVCVDSIIGSGSDVTGLAGICILLMASENWLEIMRDIRPTSGNGNAPENCLASDKNSPADGAQNNSATTSFSVFSVR